MKKGIWVTNVCPLCMRKIITDEIFAEILRTISQGNLEKALKIVYKVEDLAKFDILTPKGKEVVEALENIPILYPVCKNCIKHARGKEFRERIEKSLSQNKHILNKVENFDLKQWISKPRESGCIF